MEEVLHPQLAQLLKVHYASERSKFLARADLYEEYISRAKRVVKLPDLVIDAVWEEAIRVLLKQGLTDQGLYTLVAAIARTLGQSPSMDFLTPDPI